MLDGLLGRRFSSKCKSLIKITKTRIDAIRRKRNAMQKFLKKDIADLLANDLDTNAYSRAQGLIIELNHSSCYDFVEQFCGCISKHLSIMQKQRECPEECREAVPSLISAAARFADLPELRDLRHILTEKYGNSLESFANQEFLEKLASKPPTTDKKLQLLRNIAQEFSIKWDSKAFEQKIYNPPASAHAQPRKHRSVSDTFNDGSKLRNGRDDAVLERDNLVLSPQGMQKPSDVVHRPHNSREDIVSEGDDQDISSHGRWREHTDDGYKPWNGREGTTKQQAKTDNKEIPVAGNNDNGKHNLSNSIKKVSEEETDSINPYYNNVIRPHYVKPKGGKCETKLEAWHAGFDCSEAPTDPPTDHGSITNNRPERFQTVLDGVKYERHEVEPARVNGHGNDKDDHHYQDNSVDDSKPKPRSVRRRHLKPPPGHENIGDFEVDGVVKSNSSDRRREEARQSLQPPFDDDHDQMDEEEKMMDRLLIHYSKKQSAYEPGKVRTGLKTPPSHHVSHDAGDSLQYRSRNGAYLNTESIPCPARAASVPSKPRTSTEAAKGHARATSLQPEMLNTAGHVHPKLPDYDDLAAQFAALRGS